VCGPLNCQTAFHARKALGLNFLLQLTKESSIFMIFIPWPSCLLVKWNHAHSSPMLNGDQQISPRSASSSPLRLQTFFFCFVPASHRPVHTPVSSKGRMCLPINWPITRTQHAGIGSECNHHSGDLESWGLQQKGV
jgi:hypothetical protein